MLGDLKGGAWKACDVTSNVMLRISPILERIEGIPRASFWRSFFSPASEFCKIKRLVLGVGNFPPGPGNWKAYPFPKTTEKS